MTYQVAGHKYNSHFDAALHVYQEACCATLYNAFHNTPRSAAYNAPPNASHNAPITAYYHAAY